MATCVHLGTCDGNGAQFNVYTTWQSVIAATASQRRPDNVKIRKWKKVRNSTLQCIRLKHIAHTIPPTIRMLTDAFLFTFLFLRPIYFSMESNEWWSIKSTKKSTTSSSSNDDHIHNDNTVNRFLFSVCCCRFPWIFFFCSLFHSSILFVVVAAPSAFIVLLYTLFACAFLECSFSQRSRIERYGQTERKVRKNTMWKGNINGLYVL